MTITMKLMSPMISLMIPMSVWAGPRSGGGGFGVSCPATPVSAASLELLDLYEARAAGHQMQTPLGDFKQEYLRAVGRLNAMAGAPNYVDEYRENIEENLKKFFQSVQWLKNKKDLPVAQDLGKVPWIPSQCELKQIAYFDDWNKTIYILQDEYNLLMPQDQAALVFHELWFSYSRSLGETSSEFSRRLTGFGFVSTKFNSIFNGPFPHESEIWFGLEKAASNGALVTADQTATALVTSFQDATKTKMIFLFQHLFGRPLFTETFAVLPAMNLEFEIIPVTKPFPHLVRVLKTPDLHIDFTVPVRGAAFEGMGYEIHIYGQTGSSLFMDLLLHKQVLQTSYTTL